MHVPLVDLRAQYFGISREITDAIYRVLAKGNYVMGEEVEAFEKEWAGYCKAKYCVGVSSGTDALYLALKVLKPEGKQRILTSPFTFFSTVEAIIKSGNYPIFIDIGSDGNIHIPDNIPGSYAYCYIPVYLYGKPTAFPRDRFVIEDAAQAHGLPLGGDLMCHSFYPTKNLGAYGQAGSIVTNSSEWAEKLKWLRVHGEKERFIHYEVTGNYRMDELQAAILRVKLPYLDRWNRVRRNIAENYRQVLQDVEAIILPEDDPYHFYYAFVIRVRGRDNLAKFLAGNGIQTTVRYLVPMHLLPALKYLGYKKGDFPMAEKLADENLNLPIYPEMTTEQVVYVAEKIKEWVNEQ